MNKDRKENNSARLKQQEIAFTLLAKRSPTVEEIYHQRFGVGSFTKKEAAKLCGVSNRTWRRWENGGQPMPLVVWSWFKGVTTGGLAFGGERWNGWTYL